MDLVLLDLGLPDVRGEEVARELRLASDVPIVILTARSEESDRIAGLELGADDYTTKRPSGPVRRRLPASCSVSDFASDQALEVPTETLGDTGKRVRKPNVG